MVVIIALDLLSLVERYGNIIGDYSPHGALQTLTFLPLLPAFFLFKKANFSRDSTKRLTYSRWWRHVTKIFLAVALVSPVLVAIPRRDLSSRLPVVIGDVEDTTRNQAFAKIATHELLALALKQSPRLEVFPEDNLAETLRRMKKAPQTPITDSVGREICAREGVGPLVTWSAADAGEGFILEARILNPGDGSILRRITAGPFGDDAVLEAISELGKEVQKSFGDSSLQVYMLTKPLKPATTTSLAALQAYSAALQEFKERDYQTGEQKLLEALKFDPDFAMAGVELASLYDFRGDTISAIGYIKKAFERRDSLTESERVRVNEYYYWLVENDHAKSIDEMNEFVRKYPRNEERLPGLALSNFLLMKFDVAEGVSHRILSQRPWRKELAEDVIALWHTQLSRGDVQQTLETAKQIQTDIPDLNDNPYLLYVPRLAFGENPEVENEIATLAGDENKEARLCLGGLRDLYHGKLQATLEEWTQYISVMNRERSELPWMDNEGTAHLSIARVALLSGNTTEVRRNLEGVKDVPEEFLAEAGKYYARIGDLESAQALLNKLRIRLAGRQTNQNQLLLDLLQSEIELKKGNTEASFNLLFQAPNYAWAYLYWQVQESRAYIALATDHPDQAINACKEMLGKKGFAFSGNRPDDWVMAHYYLGRSYEMRNMKELALNSYQEFEKLWHNGDPETPSVKFARKRIARLKL
jgi:hypothetical protein